MGFTRLGLLAMRLKTGNIRACNSHIWIGVDLATFVSDSSSDSKGLFVVDNHDEE